MEKSPEAFRTISEVADWLGVPTHVLRFWESRFSQVKPVKRAGGRRYYRPSDMALIGGIKRLLHDDGMTIRGVQKLLREQGVRHVSGLSQPLFEDDEPAGEVIDATAEPVEEATVVAFSRGAQADEPPEPEAESEPAGSVAAEAPAEPAEPVSEAEAEPGPGVSAEASEEVASDDLAPADAETMPSADGQTPLPPVEDEAPEVVLPLDETAEESPADSPAAPEAEPDLVSLMDTDASAPAEAIPPAAEPVPEDDFEEADEADLPPELAPVSRLRLLAATTGEHDGDALRNAYDRLSALRDRIAQRTGG